VPWIPLITEPSVYGVSTDAADLIGIADHGMLTIATLQS
jgi:hypothetical protein